MQIDEITDVVINTALTGRTTSIEDAAVWYTDLGWSVLPVHGLNDSGSCTCGKTNCPSPAKHPSIADWPNKATCDVDTIQTWFLLQPHANIGIRTGGDTGLVVIDVDVKNQVDGMESLAKMKQKLGDLPQTVTANTPSGGLHYYYRVPGPVSLKTATRVLGYPGVDIRAQGGMVVAPPSRNATGQYEWQAGLSPDDAAVADLPQAWLEALPKADQTNQTATGNLGYEDKISQGGRNNTLTSIAGCFRRNGLSEAVIESALHVVNQKQCDPPLGDQEIKSIAASISRYPSSQAPELPTVILPGPGRIVDTVSRLAPLVRETGVYYQRGGTPVRLHKAAGDRFELEAIKDEEWPTIFEQVARLYKLIGGKNGPEHKPTICSIATARLIVHAATFRQALPPINLISRCPVLVEKANELRFISGYDPETGILAGGTELPELSLDQAVALLTGALTDFEFATPGDRSRAIAAIITPAMKLGGLIPGPSAVDFGEANEAQTGKGYRNKITAAIYNDEVHNVTRCKGAGGLDESFAAAVLRGSCFICLDNLRGTAESQMLESFLTEDTATLRIPYQPPVMVDPRRTIVMMTSNQAELGDDLAKRCSIVRIRKQPEDHEWAQYLEGDVLSHIRANQPLYFAAVVAVVKAWHDAGKPRLQALGHDFRAWAGIMDWIVTNIFKAESLLEGHKDIQKRAITPHLGWLRQLAFAVLQDGQNDQWLRTYQLHDTLQTHEIEIPGPATGLDADYRGKPETSPSTDWPASRKMFRCLGQKDDRRHHD